MSVDLTGMSADFKLHYHIGRIEGAATLGLKTVGDEDNRKRFEWILQDLHRLEVLLAERGL